MAELIWDGKYDDQGRRVAPPRIALPFQTVETVNESAADRAKNLDLFGGGPAPEWRNRLIWGDKKYVLPSLLKEFAGQVNLVYIDPPFATGGDFSYTATVPDGPDGEDGGTFVKQPSVIEQKAYRDTWGRGLDGYLKWFHETAVLLRDLLADDGSIYVHLDWHVAHYAKGVLDEVFGRENFLNEIVWWYYNKFQGNVRRFASDHDVIFWYRKGSNFKFEPQYEERDSPVRQIKRVWDKSKGKIVNAKDEQGKVLYQDATHRTVDDVWRLSMLQPADVTENLRYPTQKPETLLERVLDTSSTAGDLVLDCFCGSGTTAAVAEKLGRRWITCDLGRFAIHTARKRLLGIPDVRPFVVQNLGKYERQAWQAAEFGAANEAQTAAYRRFILDLYRARPVESYTWLHGIRNGRMVHVGGVEAPVTMADVTSIVAEFRRATGTGKDAPTRAGVDLLGWDFAFELNEMARQQAGAAGIDLKLVRIPREVLEPKAVEQGDIRFYELAALAVKHKVKGRQVTLDLVDFVVNPDDVPVDVQGAITHWEQWIDYWAVDWDNGGDAFHNEWQAYRTRKQKGLEKQTTHAYDAPGEYRVVVKVIDILGNDTTRVVPVEVR